MRFPDCSGDDLMRRHHAFPSAFGARPAFAIVAFDLQARDALTTWLPFLQEAVQTGSVQGWLFPVLPSPAKMMKGALEAVLRKAVPEGEARSFTVPLFVDVEAFASGLGIADRSEVAILLLDAHGEVVERASGAFSEAAGTTITARLRGLA